MIGDSPGATSALDLDTWLVESNTSMNSAEKTEEEKPRKKLHDISTITGAAPQIGLVARAPSNVTGAVRAGDTFSQQRVRDRIGVCGRRCESGRCCHHGGEDRDDGRELHCDWFGFWVWISVWMLVGSVD